jgi:hypothetical protein
MKQEQAHEKADSTGVKLYLIIHLIMMKYTNCNKSWLLIHTAGNVSFNPTMKCNLVHVLAWWVQV